MQQFKKIVVGYAEKINALTKLDKIRIYFDYFATMVTLKNDFIVLDKIRFEGETVVKSNVGLKWNHGFGLPDKEIHNIAFYYLWKDLRINSFEEFVSDKNIRIIDNGNEWKQIGFVQQVRVDYFGIYKWCETNPVYNS